MLSAVLQNNRISMEETNEHVSIPFVNANVTKRRTTIDEMRMPEMWL